MSIWDNQNNVEKLKMLWAEGLSASQIAHRFDPGGSVSRNSIISKVRRLGLSGRRARINPNGKHGRPRKKRSDGRPPSPKFSAEDISKFIVPASDDVADGGLETRRQNQCCFPIGEPGKPGFGYCKNDRDFGDYCTVHLLRMYPGAAVKLRELEEKPVEVREKEAV